MKFAIAARDPQVDIYREDDFYGLEVVEADHQEDARDHSEWFRWSDGLMGLMIWVYEVGDDVELGWHDVLLPAKEE